MPMPFKVHLALVSRSRRTYSYRGHQIVVELPGSGPDEAPSYKDSYEDEHPANPQKDELFLDAGHGCSSTTQ